MYLKPVVHCVSKKRKYMWHNFVNVGTVHHVPKPTTAAAAVRVTETADAFSDVCKPGNTLVWDLLQDGVIVSYVDFNRLSVCQWMVCVQLIFAVWMNCLKFEPTDCSTSFPRAWRRKLKKSSHKWCVWQRRNKLSCISSRLALAI